MPQSKERKKAYMRDYQRQQRGTNKEGLTAEGTNKPRIEYVTPAIHIVPSVTPSIADAVYAAVIPSHTSVTPVIPYDGPYCDECGSEMEWSCRACIVKGASSRKEHDKALTDFKKGRDGDLEFSKDKQAGKARM